MSGTRKETPAEVETPQIIKTPPVEEMPFPQASFTDYEQTEKEVEPILTQQQTQQQTPRQPPTPSRQQTPSQNQILNQQQIPSLQSTPQQQPNLPSQKNTTLLNTPQRTDTAQQELEQSPVNIAPQQAQIRHLGDPVWNRDPTERTFDPAMNSSVYTHGISEDSIAIPDSHQYAEVVGKKAQKLVTECMFGVSKVDQNIRT